MVKTPYHLGLTSDWLQYGGCRMVSLTPFYIILGEFGIALSLALLARMLRRGSSRTAIVGGLSIFACYEVAFLITDRLTK